MQLVGDRDEAAKLMQVHGAVFSFFSLSPVFFFFSLPRKGGERERGRRARLTIPAALTPHGIGYPISR